MCIILGPVNYVESTKIFVMPSEKGNRQLTVYRNSVGSDSENMMILPVPYPQTVLLETRSYPRLFKDLERSICWTRDIYEKCGAAMYRSVDTLPVIEVGSYRVSIVPSVEDFYRLNQNVFRVSQELEGLLKESYSIGTFGFLCCRLKAGAQEYEPLAYSHQRLHPDKLFVPTKHYHVDNTNHSSFQADWDHEVYSMRTTISANQCHGYPLTENHLDTRRLPKEFSVGKLEHVHCWARTGDWDNVDLEFQIIL